jgi:RNA polymerase sigma-70 factor (ECF subfamily)
MKQQMLGLATEAGISDPHASATVFDALRSLSVEHRAAIARAYYFNESLPQIARLEHIPEGTAKSRLHDALHALRLAVQERGIGR